MWIEKKNMCICVYEMNENVKKKDINIFEAPIVEKLVGKFFLQEELQVYMDIQPSRKARIWMLNLDWRAVSPIGWGSSTCNGSTAHEECPQGRKVSRSPCLPLMSLNRFNSHIHLLYI